MEDIKSYYEKDSVVVVYATDENYAQYLTVSIISLIENASKDLNYEIYVLSENLYPEYIYELEKIAEHKSNIYIRVLNINSFIENIGKKLFFESNHIKISAYYRLFIPEIFKNFKKALYLDVDTIILADVAELFNTDLDGNKIAAIPDQGLLRLKQNGSSLYQNYNKAYYNNFAKEIDIDYFNSGVMLFNLAEIDESFLAKAIEKLQNGVKPSMHDQDLLNYISKGKVKLLDSMWNSQILYFLDETGGDLQPKKLLMNNPQKYIKNTKIIHFVSHMKPWIYPELEGGKIFWHYAKKSPYYEIMLFHNIHKRNILLQRISKLELILIKINLFKYRVLSQISFGKCAERYKVEKQILKKKIRDNKCKI